MTSSQCEHFFSIITVVYNGEAYLEKTIRSVIAQDFSAYEYIVLDGKSTDSTVDIIRNYKNKISYWSSEKDLGVYDAMNKATKQAKGKYILFLNAGDVFCNAQTLTKVKSRIIDNTVYDFIYGDVILNNKVQQIVKAKSFELIKYHLPFCHQSVFVNRLIFFEQSFNLSFPVCADYEFFLNLYYKKKVTYLKVNFPISIFDLGGISYKNNVFQEYLSISKFHNGKFSLLTIYHHIKFIYKLSRTALKNILFR